MIKILFLFLLLAPAAFAGQTFELKNASKFFDVKVEVDKCEDGSCSGPATFSFYKKSGGKAYQVINLPDTYIDLGDEGKPLVNKTLLYDAQSVISVGDYNFDGMEDVAICDGNHGSYGGPSYQIYLSDRAKGQFVKSAALTGLGNALGMFKVDEKAKTIETFDKSGCCYHITERYKIVANKPVKVYVFEEDASRQGKYEGKIVLTTKTLVGGKWKTTVKVMKTDDYYKN